MSGYDVVVIGAGGGGLAAAAVLAQAGMRTLVIEQHNKVGGYMTSFTRGGYNFEVSLHNFDGLDPQHGVNHALFRQMGILHRVKPVRLEPAYNAAYPGRFFTVPAHPDAYMEYLIREFPHEAAGIRRFFRTLASMKTPLGLMRAILDGDYGRMAASAVRRPGWVGPPTRYFRASAKKLLDDHFRDERLQALISWLACYGGATLHQTSAILLLGMLAAYHHGGFYYFESGSQSVSGALADVVVAHGGTIQLSTLATKIAVSGGRARAVRTADGHEIPCRFVVSNASAPATVDTLVGREHFPQRFLRRMDALRLGATCFCLYLGVGRDYTERFRGAHTIGVSERWGAPPGFDLMADSRPEDSDLIIANYSAVDPTAAPPGKNVIAMVAPLAYDYENGWRRQGGKRAYRALKQKVARTLIRRAEAYLPGLGDAVEKLEAATPLSMERYTLNPGGSIIGWAVGSNPLELLSRLPQQTPIPNLFLAGAWQAVGGQSPVLRSGVGTARKILQRA